jgi:murein DD-endopeptidase MepM/ murein hydrolase activator NlpD
LVSVQAGPAAAVSPEERRVTAMRAQLEQLRAGRAADAGALQSAEQRLKVVMDAVGAAELAVQRQHLAVEKARADLGELQARAEQQRGVMAARAETLYKQGPAGGITTLLEAVNPQDALRRSAYADVLSRNEQRTMETVTVAHTAVEAQRTKLQTEEASLERILSDQRELLAEVERMRNDKAMALATADQQIGQLEDHLDAEDRQVAAMTRTSAGPSSSRGSAVSAPPSAARGGWTWPARGPVTSGYGPRWGRMHRGLDIGASTGAAIVAAKSGVVTYAGTMSGYGRAVIISHGGGYSSLYAHQSAISVRSGQQVGAGQRIGSVGCTGSCTGPHLHFEIRVNGVARNPASYL